MKAKNKALLLVTAGLLSLTVACGKGGAQAELASDAAERVYVPPGQYDEMYAFLSGGFNGQLTVYGIPSGRMLKVIPVFSQYSENGYGYDEETKDMLLTSHGYLPWDDSHHTEASLTNGEHDGKWMFINGNNTPRIARIDLSKFETVEIIEIPNSAGNHASPFSTENSEYLMAATRFSVPIPQKPIAIEEMSKGGFNGTVSMVKVDKKTGKMSIAAQILVPGFDYDLSHCGKKDSHDWCFFSSYNTEQAFEMLEINASKNDKDYVLALNWKKAEECVANGKGKPFSGTYYHNFKPDNLPTVSEKKSGVTLLHPNDCEGMLYLLPTPKSPHGVDVDPTGEYIVAGGKLSTVIPVHSFSKLKEAIKDESNFSKKIMGIPVLKYEATLDGEVNKPCLGMLHNEFDGKGYVYTSCFISSEIVKWDIKTKEVVQHFPSYYSIGHLTIAGGDTAKPHGKYMIALNKITKDRYLPVGMELSQSAQLYDISGERGELLLDFPTYGEPHYGQILPASLLEKKAEKIYALEENKNPYAAKSEKEARVERNGKNVHVYMTAIRSHFKPDKVEVKKGDTVYFHVTNLEQDFDIPHGFAIFGANLPNILIMPGQTRTVKYKADNLGVYPFYCTDFCSALHQEMQQYIRVSP